MGGWGEREKKRNRGKEGTPAAAGWAEGEAEAKLGSDDDAPARVGSPRLRGRLGSRAGPGCARPVTPGARLCPGARRRGDHCSPCSQAPGCLCAAARCSPSPHVFVRRPAWPEPRQAPARWGCGPGCPPGPKLHSPLASPLFPPFRTPSSCSCGVPARARLPAHPSQPYARPRRPSCQCVLPAAPSACLPLGSSSSLTCTHHPASYCHLLL